MEWQPIETAPKDGTAILIHESGIVDVASWHTLKKCFCRYDDKERGVTQYEPSFWMPLPEPPK